MVDLLILFVVAVIAFIAGWVQREQYAKYVLSKLLDSVEETEDDSDSPIKIKIEKHIDSFFVYSMETDSFMAQGSSRTELEKNLSTRYPGKKFAATQENLKEVGFI